MKLLDMFAEHIIEEKMMADIDLTNRMTEFSSAELTEIFLSAASQLNQKQFKGWLRRKLKDSMVKALLKKAAEFHDIPNN